MSEFNSLKPLAEDNAEERARQLETVLPASPFGDMALALSGGGFRAAAFSLGVLSYLHRSYWLNEEDSLLSHVSFLTSTSGGSITSACYSTALYKDGFNFKNFYEKTKNLLQGEDLLTKALEFLDNGNLWKEEGTKTEIRGDKQVKQIVKKNRNLINAFAKAYDELAFKGEQFNIYFKKVANPHLITVCFNATEFNNGISFRFQTNGNPKNIHILGNYYLKFNNAAVAGSLKISDIVAASSCFPSGFEPIVYPDDFVHSELHDLNKMADAISYEHNDPLKKDDVHKQPFCLMDGGIVDNQGLGSMMMEDDFRRKHKSKRPFDLMMVCDVGSYFLDAYKIPEKKNSSFGNLTGQFIINLLIISVFVFAGSIFSVLSGYVLQVGLLLLIPSGILYLFLLYLIYLFIKVKCDTGKRGMGAVFFRNFGFFLKMKLGILQQMLLDRGYSTVFMASELFLKQIRRQYYSTFYTMPAYHNRRLSCFIYEFATKHSNKRESNLRKEGNVFTPEVLSLLEPSIEIRVCADIATNTSTTLWFDSKSGYKTRNAIIACGQFTICYNLIKYIYRLQALDERWEKDSILNSLKSRLLLDWKAFKEDPEFMV